MTDNSRDYFEQLAALLEEHGFGWALSQVRAQIAEGIIVDKDVREFEAPRIAEATFQVGRRSRRSARLIARVPYDDDQRLAILLKAIEAAIVQRAELEEAVLDSLNSDENGPKLDRVEFVPDDDEDAAVASSFRRHQVSNDRRADNSELKEAAARALAEIRADVR